MIGIISIGENLANLLRAHFRASELFSKMKGEGLADRFMAENRGIDIARHGRLIRSRSAGFEAQSRPYRRRGANVGIVFHGVHWPVLHSG